MKKYIELKEVNSTYEGPQLVVSNKANNIIHISSDYSENLKTHKSAKIDIIASKYNNYTSDIVKNVVDSYNSVSNAIYVMKDEGNKYERYNVIDENVIDIKNKRPTSIDYYVIAMLILSMISGAHLASSAIGEEYYKPMGRRIKSGPVKEIEIFIGKVIACVISICAKSVIIIAFSKIVFHSNFGSNYLKLAFIIVTVSIMACSFGMMITMVTGIEKSSRIISTVVNVSTFIGGGYAVMIGVNVNTAKIMHYSPTFLAQTAIFNTIYIDGFRATYQFYSTNEYIYQMWLISVVMFLIVFLVGRRKKYDSFSN